MSAKTSIEWTRGDDGTPGKTWNPVRGCALVSPGCTNCYAMKFAHRFSAGGQPYAGLTTLTKHHGPRWTGSARMVPEALAEPLHWRKPCRVFVNSMSDLFHEDLSDDEIAAVFSVMAACPQHTFQVLTKRAARMRAWFAWLEDARRGYLHEHRGPLFKALAAVGGEPLERAAWARVIAGREPPTSIGDACSHGGWPLPNVWLGVSVESQKYADERIPELLATPAAVRFLSCEPLLGPLNLHAALCAHGHPDGSHPEQLFGGWCTPRGAIHWCIVGGESGPGARPFHLGWARDIVRQCRDAEVACFVKQLGTWPSTAQANSLLRDPNYRLALRDHKGGDMREWPEDLRVREWPEVRDAR